MPTARLPKYRVLREGPEGWEPAQWPDGRPAYRVGLNPDASRVGACTDAVALGVVEPEAVLIVVDPDDAEVFRVEPTPAVPF